MLLASCFRIDTPAPAQGVASTLSERVMELERLGGADR
jgi:hypothetical protein